MMSKTGAMAAVMAAALFVSSSASGESIDSIFNDANNAFWNGKYEKAAKLYEKIESLGASDSALSYNLGTAYARMGRLGKAIQHYERALRQSPGDADALHNLAAVREFIARRANEAGRDADLAPGVSAWRAVLDRFSADSSAVSFLVFHIALFAVLILRRFVSSEMPRLTLGVTAGVLAVLAAATLAVAAGKLYQEQYMKEAVVVADGQLDVMEGPGSKVRRFSLEEGSRVRIVEDKQGWSKLRDADGRDGWAAAEKLGRI